MPGIRQRASAREPRKANNRMGSALRVHENTPADWDSALDALESDMAASARFIAQLGLSGESHATFDLPQWNPPASLGAPTAAQRARARSLAATLANHEREVETTIEVTMLALQHVAQQLGPHRSRSAAISNNGSFEARA